MTSNPVLRAVRIAAPSALLCATLVTPAAAIVIHNLPAAEGECFMLRPLDREEMFVSNPLECRVRSAPASTFKIPHALIALESRVITASSVSKWNGRKQPFESWQRSHSLQSAIRSSVLWFFQGTATAIGRQRMTEWLELLRYGDDSFQGDIATFWINGDFVISPEQQLDFLTRMFGRQLPVSPASLDAVIRAMTMPRGAIINASGTHAFATGWPAGTRIRAKTGNTTVDGERASWLIGGLETGGREFVFTARVRSRQPLGTTAGADVARRHLRAVRRTANR